MNKCINKNNIILKLLKNEWIIFYILFGKIILKKLILHFTCIHYLYDEIGNVSILNYTNMHETLYIIYKSYLIY